MGYNLIIAYDTKQSAYRKFHSSEIILLSILDDFLNKLIIIIIYRLFY